jgi:hypothetical protein
VGAKAAILALEGDSIGFAQVTLVESRAHVPGRSISWYVTSPGLRGHITDARLVAAEDTSSHLLSLPAGGATHDIALWGDFTPYTGSADFNDLFDRAVAGHLTMVLPTDIPDREVIVVPLQRSTYNNWRPVACD